MGGESLRKPNRGVSEKIAVFRDKNFPGEDFWETFAYFTCIVMKQSQDWSNNGTTKSFVLLWLDRR
jgi:hypothetical protein